MPTIFIGLLALALVLLRTIRSGDVPMAPGTPSSHEDGQPSAPGGQLGV